MLQFQLCRCSACQTFMSSGRSIKYAIAVQVVKLVERLGRVYLRCRSGSVVLTQWAGKNIDIRSTTVRSGNKNNMFYIIIWMAYYAQAPSVDVDYIVGTRSVRRPFATPCNNDNVVRSKLYVILFWPTWTCSTCTHTHTNENIINIGCNINEDIRVMFSALHRQRRPVEATRKHRHRARLTWLHKLWY